MNHQFELELSTVTTIVCCRFWQNIVEFGQYLGKFLLKYKKV